MPPSERRLLGLVTLLGHSIETCYMVLCFTQIVTSGLGDSHDYNQSGFFFHSIMLSLESGGKCIEARGVSDVPSGEKQSERAALRDLLVPTRVTELIFAPLFRHAVARMCNQLARYLIIRRLDTECLS
ncbi:hypothetical protein PILCRDRAFT_332117 [Piloderma croceum F 1598]|uniref:Uncharacterized protein n=1 Tax=Piloderma croceum (strain F 1598) TaxID=765440 RepID=A0A0C3G5W5_PILCF|nr:hypothetical protein PILCRDRAFT_332117 [Piloderma croceum F 1598]